MANEAVCIETPTEFRQYTIADGTAIPFGTVLKLTDPNTAIASSADNDPFAGICWVAKAANDGITTVVAAVNGAWDMLTSAATEVAGAIVNISAANTVGQSAAADLLTGSVVGKLEETAGNAEVARVRVGTLV